jgi:hypothetical protein
VIGRKGERSDRELGRALEAWGEHKWEIVPNALLEKVTICGPTRTAGT